jgi:hypothetical protein
MVTGECFCGGIGYEYTGRLKDPLACHCSRCRKAFSSQSSNYARIQSEGFSWISGENLLTSFVGKHGFGLLFCSVCGSTLCGVFDDEIHGVTLGCLNDEPDIEEIHHIFVDSKAGWEVMPASVTMYSEGREDRDRRD